MREEYYSYCLSYRVARCLNRATYDAIERVIEKDSIRDIQDKQHARRARE